MKCGIDEVPKLVQDSLEENISRESFDKILQSLIDSNFVKYNSISMTVGWGDGSLGATYPTSPPFEI